MAKKVRLHLLTGARIYDTEGRALGRIEEIRAAREGEAWVVKGYVVGAYGMMRRLSAWTIGRLIISYLPGTWRDVREIPWHDVDISDPARPRLRAAVDVSEARPAGGVTRVPPARHNGFVSRRDDLDRIGTALRRAGDVLRGFDHRRVGVAYKEHGSPVTDADRAADEMLRRELPREGEGWLSEESPDDGARLARRRVWIVDPLDGTREFIAGVPEWCVSIGLAEDGVAVAGGVYAPMRDELFLGSLEGGVTLNGAPVTVSGRASLDGGVVLVNRWTLVKRRGRRLQGRGFDVRAVGPLAYTLALIAAGRADATWSRSPKAEWDIAAGAALIRAAGGQVTDWDGAPLVFNRWPPRSPGLVAAGGGVQRAVRRLVAEEAAHAARPH